MLTLAIFFGAYLIGSIPFAILVSRAFGLSDPRSYGSGNPGATNVLRSGNKLAALFTLLGDAAKGVLVVWLARSLGAQFGATPIDSALAALAVFLGHVFSLFLRFKGGKGVATAAGVLFGISWQLGLLVLGVWAAVALITRYSSAAALSAALAAPVATAWLVGSIEWVAAVIAMAVLLIQRHRENIQRLFSGREGKIGEKK